MRYLKERIEKIDEILKMRTINIAWKFKMIANIVRDEDWKPTEIKRAHER